MLRIYFIVLVALLVACSPTKQKVEQVSTIDSTLQIKVDSILQNKLSELDATVGQVIVMEVQTGEIKASVGSDSILQESGLVRTASLLAALETKAVKLSDTIDVDNGILARFEGMENHVSPKSNSTLQYEQGYHKSNHEPSMSDSSQDPWDGISSIGLFASANAQTFESFPEDESSKKKKKKRRRGFSL